MIERSWAEDFARDWIDSWNAHDLDRILAHYADDFEMTSPLIVQRLGVVDGKLTGKKAVRRYWSQGLASVPELRFKLIDVIVGVNSVAIFYESHALARTVVEYIQFNEQKLGVRAEALHGGAAPNATACGVRDHPDDAADILPSVPGSGEATAPRP